MEKAIRSSRKDPSTNTSVFLLKNERGFTYIELIIALSILLLLFPALFLCAQTWEQEVRKLLEKDRLLMEYRAFLSYVQNEMKQGAHFRTENGALLFEVPTGETIRYELKSRQVIRRVKKADEKHLKGTMILLQHVYLILFIPDESGVLLHVGLQSWSADMEMKIYIHGRSRSGSARN